MKSIKGKSAKRVFRDMIRYLLLNFGGERGRRTFRYIMAKRNPPIFAPSWNNLSESDRMNVIDNNFPIDDHYCPICDATSSFNIMADRVGTHLSITVRKILHQCEKCNLLFTNEKLMGENYFTLSPYQNDYSGLLTPREIDMALLGIKLTNTNKSANVLIYAIGMNNTITKLNDAGFNNVWGSDISVDLDYGEKLINIRNCPIYFSSSNIKFDVIVCCEVWEHYNRISINDDFKWIFENLSENGIVVGSTSLWFANQSDDVNYNLSNEWGKEQLKRWHYAYCEDHHTFYRPQNLMKIGERFGIYTSFGYFSDEKIQYEDPFKRVIAFTPQGNEQIIANLKNKFENKYHDIFYW